MSMTPGRSTPHNTRPRGKNWTEADSLKLIEAYAFVEAIKEGMEWCFTVSNPQKMNTAMS